MSMDDRWIRKMELYCQAHVGSPFVPAQHKEWFRKGYETAITDLRIEMRKEREKKMSNIKAITAGELLKKIDGYAVTETQAEGFKLAVKALKEILERDNWMVTEGNSPRKPVELKDTVDLMTSADWKDRFVAEWMQTKIRYEKLHKLIVKREVGKCDFETQIPLESWKEQAKHMGLYLYELEKQAALHGIELPLP